MEGRAAVVSLLEEVRSTGTPLPRASLPSSPKYTGETGLDEPTSSVPHGSADIKRHRHHQQF